MERAPLVLTGALPMLLIVACATAFPVSLTLVCDVPQSRACGDAIAIVSHDAHDGPT